MRVLAVYDGDADRSRAVIRLVVEELQAVMGPEQYASAVQIRELDISREVSRRAQRAQCRRAELVVGLDADHLRGLAVPLLSRHRVFTLEELTLTLETIAHTAAVQAIVSISDRGYAGFSRSVVGAACAARGLVPNLGRFGVSRRAEAVDDYAPRLARAFSELAIGRHWAV